MEGDLGENPWDETPSPSQPEKTPTRTHCELDDVDQALLKGQQVHADDDSDNDRRSDKSDEQDPEIVRKFPNSVQVGSATYRRSYPTDHLASGHLQRH